MQSPTLPRRSNNAMRMEMDPPLTKGRRVAGPKAAPWDDTWRALNGTRAAERRQINRKD